MLLLRRGSVHVEPTRSVHALAAGRAAVEAEQALGEPRFYLRRNGSVTFCAVNDAWANYADRLGQMVDRLLASDVVVSPQRAMEDLGAYDPPDGEKPLTPARLMTLAAAASLTGAVSANRLELYRKGIDAARSLKLASSALVGVDQLTVEAIGERVRSRYPEAQPLPDRPALDALLEEAGLVGVPNACSRSWRGCASFCRG